MKSVPEGFLETFKGEQVGFRSLLGGVMVFQGVPVVFQKNLCEFQEVFRGFGSVSESLMKVQEVIRGILCSQEDSASYKPFSGSFRGFRGPLDGRHYGSRV